MEILVVVDMQNDFITGHLGTEEAQAIVPKVVQRIRDFDGGLCPALGDVPGSKEF